MGDAVSDDDERWSVETDPGSIMAVLFMAFAALLLILDLAASTAVDLVDAWRCADDPPEAVVCECAEPPDGATEEP